MKQKQVLILSLLILITVRPAFSAPTPVRVLETKSISGKNVARSLVSASLEAMGGEAKIRALRSIKFEGVGHIFSVEQSERPEGPWIVNYLQLAETRDLVKERVRTATKLRNGQVADWSENTQIVADGNAAAERAGKYFPASPLQVEAASQNLAFAPERILIKALEASDLRAGPEVELQGVRQRTVSFSWNRIPVTIYLNSDTGLPTAVDTTVHSPYDHFWVIWGDYTVRTLYTYWTLARGGIRYPHQWDVERLGKPYSSFTVTKLSIDSPIEEKDFTIPENVKQQAATLPKLVKIDEIPLGRPDKPAKEIAPGVVKLAGRWDVAFVDQGDGVVIIEAPISSGYSEKVLDEAKRRFPQKHVKAVITTSDAFPHLGGVREYAARGIPIYALDRNQPILRRLLAASYRTDPDLLQSKPRKADLKIISGKSSLGVGANRIEMYPLRTETGERMMMIYFPEHKLLYASDLVQKSLKGGFFMPQYVSEVLDAAKRENLQVENVFALHTDVTPWSELISEMDSLLGTRKL